MRVLLVLLLAGCSAPAPGPADGASDPVVAPVPTPDDLALARAKWADAALDGYTMTITRSCFCPPEYRGPYTVAVDGGEVSSVLYGGQPAEAGEPPTVDALFALLETAYAEGAARVDVDYHDELGYPVELYIDRDTRLADEEVGYSISELIER